MVTSLASEPVADREVGWVGGLAEWVEDSTVYLSVAFTWMLNEVRSRALSTMGMEFALMSVHMTSGSLPTPYPRATDGGAGALPLKYRDQQSINYPDRSHPRERH
jgi:hypothetical protein